MDIVGPELSEPANTISSFKLAGLWGSAIRLSNAQYDDPDMLDRLRVKMMPQNTGDRGWDVFSLEYDARVPLNTVFTESVLSRKCHVLWDEMNNFVSNLQYYIMFEVLEVSWSTLLKEMEVAKDLDELLRAREKYLYSIVEKSLLGEQSQNLNKTLFILFDIIVRFRSQADRLYEGIYEFLSRNRRSRTTDFSFPSQFKAKSQRQSNDKSSEPGSWLGEGRKDLTCQGISSKNGSRYRKNCKGILICF
ncbi:Gamma-tubulin complex component 3 [Abeliophyllum distichum]|uniref:Gamma-tubulin complex component 3 n=1 Tax=Abeliophyllum distichum TaxID=126358 RepID=A0ABD1QJS8_9LAMI